MLEEDDKEIERRRRFRLERRVTIGEIIGIISIIGAVYTKGNAILDEFRNTTTQIEKRLAVLEAKGEMQNRTDSAQDQLIRDGQQRIEAQLLELSRAVRELQRPAARP